MQLAHRLLKPFTRWIWRRADRVVAVCESLGRQTLQTSPGLRYTVVPNGVDLARFCPPATECGNGRRTIRCLAVARLIERKGLGELIRAFARLERGRFELDIVGGGPDEAVLRGLVSSYGLGQEVRFRGCSTAPP